MENFLASNIKVIPHRVVPVDGDVFPGDVRTLFGHAGLLDDRNWPGEQIFSDSLRIFMIQLVPMGQDVGPKLRGGAKLKFGFIRGA